MARRTQAKLRRSPQTISLLNIAEPYAYASVRTGGVMGNSPIGVLGFDGSGAAGGAGYGMVTTNGSMTLQSIISDPGSSFDSMSSMFMANYQAMAVSAIGIGITFKFAKKLLRKPIANVNRNLLAPIGIGVKL